MGDETASVAFAVLADGTALPINAITNVEMPSDTMSQEPGVAWSGTFSAPVELNAPVFDELSKIPLRRPVCIEMETADMVRFPGASRFMRSRRLWQCRRGRRNEADERRKLARKRAHVTSVRRRLVFPSAVMVGDFERNEVAFCVKGSERS